MRISDWSSDVCSSDLLAERVKELALVECRHAASGESISEFLQDVLLGGWIEFAINGQPPDAALLVPLVHDQPHQLAVQVCRAVGNVACPLEDQEIGRAPCTERE